MPAAPEQKTDARARPSVAASLACFRNGKALIARRGRAPNKGLWSLPGGAVELGEPAAQAAAREFEEETGAKAEVIGLADIVEAIARDEDGRAFRHAVILAYAGRLVSGEPRAGEEAAAVAWVALADLDDYETTPGLAEVLAKAAEIAAC